jgi:hypothetical protein
MEIMVMFTTRGCTLSPECHVQYARMPCTVSPEQGVQFHRNEVYSLLRNMYKMAENNENAIENKEKVVEEEQCTYLEKRESTGYLNYVCGISHVPGNAAALTCTYLKMTEPDYVENCCKGNYKECIILKNPMIR